MITPKNPNKQKIEPPKRNTPITPKPTKENPPSSTKKPKEIRYTKSSNKKDQTPNNTCPSPNIIQQEQLKPKTPQTNQQAIKFSTTKATPIIIASKANLKSMLSPKSQTSNSKSPEIKNTKNSNNKKY